MSNPDRPVNGNDPDMPKPPTVPIPRPKGLRWLTYGHSVAAKPGVGEVHVTYRRWSGRITDVVVRPEGHEPLQLGRLSSATVQYLALSRTAQDLHRRARQVQLDRQLIEALAEFAGGTSPP